MNKQKQQIDMTVGNPLKLLVAFAIPILIGNACQLLYNMVDSMIAGHFIGADALAAVGTCNSPYGFFVNLNMGVATGVGIIVSQYFGARRENEVKAILGNALLILGVSSVITSIAGWFLAPSILHLMQVPADVFEDAVMYLRLVFLCMVGLAVYNLTAGVMRSLGDSRTPLYFLILSSVINMILDITFVTVFKLGVFGIALATLIGQYISATITFLYAHKKYDCFKFKKEDFNVQPVLIKKILKAGIPLGLQSATIALSGVFLQSFINSFGSVIMAATSVANRFDNIDNLALNSMAMAMSTFIGQNIGAKKLDRVKKAYKIFWIYGAVHATIMFILGHTVARYFMMVFVQDEQVIAYGVKAIGIYSTFVIFLANLYINRSIINGSGDTVAAMIGGFMEVVGRLGAVALLVLVFKVGEVGLWYAVCFCWFITGIFFLCRFLSGKWKTKSFV